MNGKNNLKAFICLMRRLVGLKKMTYGKKYEIHILKERIVTIIQTKKSRSIFAETVAAVFNDNGGF